MLSWTHSYICIYAIILKGSPSRFGNIETLGNIRIVSKRPYTIAWGIGLFDLYVRKKWKETRYKYSNIMPISIQIVNRSPESNSRLNVNLFRIKVTHENTYPIV